MFLNSRVEKNRDSIHGQYSNSFNKSLKRKSDLDNSPDTKRGRFNLEEYSDEEENKNDSPKSFYNRISNLFNWAMPFRNTSLHNFLNNMPFINYRNSEPVNNINLPPPIPRRKDSPIPVSKGLHKAFRTSKKLNDTTLKQTNKIKKDIRPSPAFSSHKNNNLRMTKANGVEPLFIPKPFIRNDEHSSFDSLNKERYRLLLQQYTSEKTKSAGSRPRTATKDAQVQIDLRNDLLYTPTHNNPPVVKRKTLTEKEQQVLEEQIRSNRKHLNEKNTSFASSSFGLPRKFHQPDYLASTRSDAFSSKWLTDLRKSLETDDERARQIEENRAKVQTYKSKREAIQKSRLEKIEQNKSKALLLEIPEDIVPELPELTPEMEEIIDEALYPTPPDETIVEGFHQCVRRRDIETLANTNWLNDEIINFYMNLIVERSKLDNYPKTYAFNTFFYPKLISGGHNALKRWTRKLDIFSFDFIVVPVHMGIHWCLAVIDFRHKKIQYYDSMGAKNAECLKALKIYLQEERKDKKKEEFDMSDWTAECVKNIPAQMNGSDCGMFALKYAEYITRDVKISFTQSDMPYFRRRMVYEIKTKTLL